MKIIETIKEMQIFADEQRKKQKTIGLVPTMGYLHEGHASLIERSSKECDVTVVSIFVNPTQFGAGEDLDKYPRDLENDIKISEKCGADVIFAPKNSEIYPENFFTYVNIETLSENLCGKSRPTHFRGVTTVVSKLFNISKPHRAYFGQKDAQQLCIIKKMTRDLNFDIEIVPCETVREDDGLAKSSRNVYLSSDERKQAPILYKSLLSAEDLIKKGETDSENIISEMQSLIVSKTDAAIDYIEIVDFETLKPIKTIIKPCLIALAVKFGSARLIDNIIIPN